MRQAILLLVVAAVLALAAGVVFAEDKNCASTAGAIAWGPEGTTP
jgi:hypothetical protein